MSLDKVIVDLSKAFDPEQQYVARKQFPFYYLEEVKR